MFSLLSFFLILLLLLPALFFLIYFNVATLSLAKLGLSPFGALFVFSLSLIGSVVNIPISRRTFVIEEPRPYPGFLPFILYYYPPRVQEQVIAVNLGGAIIPSIFSLYLLFNGAPIFQSILATAIVAWLAWRLAKPVKGVGITMPAFIPPLVAAATAIILAPHHAPSVAYIAGVWGTLIGADIMNIPNFPGLGAQVISIGGAGIYDGIFLVGIIAALLS
jgi:uncharacterized membrane protein